MRYDSFSIVAVTLSIGAFMCAAPDAAAQNLPTEAHLASTPKPDAPSPSSIKGTYDAKLAMNLSLWPTAAASLVGGFMIIISYPVEHRDRGSSFARGIELRFSGAIVGELGLISGPSLGHFYAGERLEPWLMTIGRSLFSGILDTGMVFALAYKECGAFDFPCEDEKRALQERNTGISLDVIGGVGLFALTIVDLATLKRHVARANEATHRNAVAVLPIFGGDFGLLSVAAGF
jgi:hypothetical protein